jgi:large repetitive protein
VIDTGAHTIRNAGTISARAGGGVEVESAIANTGLLVAAGGTLTLDKAVTGAGSARIYSGEIVAAGAFKENVAFDGASGTLVLTQAYAGKITGFSHTGSTSFDLREIGFVSAAEATFSGTTAGGTLTVTDGTHTAKIALVGDYTGAAFVAASDGHGGTTVIDPAVHAFIAASAATGAPSGGSASLDSSTPADPPQLLHPRG